MNRRRSPEQFPHDPTAWLRRDDNFFNLHNSSAQKHWGKKEQLYAHMNGNELIWNDRLNTVLSQALMVFH
jgi:hypothetical protein